jgi:hypothetical protein
MAKQVKPQTQSRPPNYTPKPSPANGVTQENKVLPIPGGTGISSDQVREA